jgi:hypothetical protein
VPLGSSTTALSIARHGPLANPGLGQRNQAGSRERFLERSWKATVATGGDLLCWLKARRRFLSSHR